MKIAEISTLALRYAAVVYIMSLLETAAPRIVFHLICHSLGGLFIAVVFIVGHNTIDIFTSEEMKNTHILHSRS